MVDVVRRLRIEVAERVVADRGEVDDRVEAGEVLGLYVADVAPDRLDPVSGIAKGAAGKEIGVEPHNLVPRLLDERH